MKKLGIFYGSTTGNTEHIATEIQRLIGADLVDIFDIDGATIEDVNKYENLAFGIPTWDIGELQEDWISWIENIDDPKIEVKGKKFSVFGAGDQDGYPDTFGDAIGILHDKLVARGGIPVVNKWPIDSYEFEESIGKRGEFFVGMLIDEDYQPELTKKRIEKWVEIAKSEYS